MEAALVTRTTKAGQTLEIGVKRYIRGSWIATATLDGKYAASGSVLELEPTIKAQLPGYTHFLAHTRAPIAIKADEAAILLAAIAAGEQADRETPEAQAEQLRREREALVSDIRAALADQADAFERAHAREDVLAWDIKRSHEPHIAAARAALAAFDAAHPEVVAAIRAEKAEAAERFARTN